MFSSWYLKLSNFAATEKFVAALFKLQNNNSFQVKKILAVVFGLFLVISGFPQSIFSARIVDQDTKLPLSGATIIVTNNKLGTYANEEGLFSIAVAKSDSVKITCIGYRDTMLLSNSFNSTVIEMNPRVNHLENIAVFSSVGKKTSLGYTDKKTIRTSYGGTKGAILIVYVSNKNIEIDNIIGSLTYNLTLFHLENEKPKKGVIRARLFSCNDSTNDPGRNLLPENLMRTVSGREGIISFDISKYMIRFPKNGVFVGLEWLGEIGSSKEINISPGYMITKEVIDPLTHISFYGRAFKKVGKVLDFFHVPSFGVELLESK